MKLSIPGLLFPGSFLNYKFNFTTGDLSVQIGYFFLIQSWKVVCF